MGLAAFFGREPKLPQRPRRRTSRWLREAAESESARRLVEEQMQTNPVVMAALVSQKTGLKIRPEDIVVMTPEERFKLALANQVIRDVPNDRRLIAEAREMMLDTVYDTGGQRSRRSGYRVGRDWDDDDDGYPSPYYEAGMNPADPLWVLDQAEAIRARLGRPSTLSTLLNSPVVAEAAKALIQVFLGARNGEQQTQNAASSVILVEVDGEYVEMTRAGYETWKRLTVRRAEKGDTSASLQAGTGPATTPDGTPEDSQSAPETPASPASPPPPVSDATSSALAADPTDTTPVPPNAGAVPVPLDDKTRADFAALGEEFFTEAETRTPEQYASYLKAQATAGDTHAQVFLWFLGSGITYEDIVAKVQPYKCYEDLKPYISKLEMKKDYVGALIKAAAAGPASSETGS